MLRGWCNNWLRHGVSKRTFGYLDHYAFWRVVNWLKKRHLGLNMHTLAVATSPDGRSAQEGSNCSDPVGSPSCDTATAAPRFPHHGRAQPQQRHEHMESRMQWKLHVRFGGRAGETHQPRS
ncbi:MAG: hypothetical protein OXS29_15320 [bacterium]|nr:hypothetical protein [bacterium]